MCPEADLKKPGKDTVGKCTCQNAVYLRLDNRNNPLLQVVMISFYW